MLLGGPGTTETFEAFSIGGGGAVGISCSPLNSSAICNGQGPGLVVAGVSFTFGTGGGQWDGAGYYGSPSKELLSGAPAGQPLVIDFATPVGAFGVDLRAFTGFPATAALTIYGPDRTTVTGTLSGISLSTSGIPVFAGWQDSFGIGRVALTETGWPWSPIIDNLQFGLGGGSGCATHVHGHAFPFGHEDPTAHFFGHKAGTPGHGHHFTCANHAFGHTPYIGYHLQPDSGEDLANPAFVAGLNQDGSANGAKPAKRGSVLQLFGSAAGIFVGQEDDEQPAIHFTPPASGSPLFYTTSSPHVRIGGVAANVLFSGLAPGLTGVWQINVQIPEGAPVGKAPVTVSYEGYELRSVDIAVE